MKKLFWTSLLLGLILPAMVSGKTLFVPDQYPAIQAAIDRASDGDRILVSPGTYIENIDFLSKNIDVIGVGGSENTIISAPCPRPVVTIRFIYGSGALLEGFTIRDGEAPLGAGIHLNDAIVTIQNNTIINNHAIGDSRQGIDALGGGIYSLNSIAVFHNNLITENSATVPASTGSETITGASAMGGGLYIQPGNCQITDCIFSHNIVEGGSVTTRTQVNDTAHAYGGNSTGAGLCIMGRIFQVPDQISNCTFNGNIARGGSTEAWHTAESFAGHARGGGLYIENSWENIFTDCVFSENSVIAGHATSISGVENLSVGGDAAGAGICCDFNEFRLGTRRCLFRNNQAQSGDGLLYYSPDFPPVTAVNGAARGAAIYTAAAAEYSLENTVFHDNAILDSHSNSSGSTLFSDANATAQHVTVLRSSGAEAIAGEGSVQFTNSLLFDNHDGHGMFQADFSNIEGGWTGTGNIDADPELFDEFHLMPYSPCIDVGTSLPIDHDIDMDPRPNLSGYDMGADEFAAPTPNPTITPPPSPTTTPTVPAATATPSTVAVTLEMPRYYFLECDTFYLNIRIWNPGNAIPGAHLVAALEFGGQYWFMPSWTLFDGDTGNGFDYFILENGLESGETRQVAMEPFSWPDESTGTTAQAFFYGAVLNPEMTEVIGNLAVEPWGFRY